MRQEDFDYFTKENQENIYIEDRGGRLGRYAVYYNLVVIDDCLNKKQAYRLAKSEQKYRRKVK